MPCFLKIRWIIPGLVLAAVAAATTVWLLRPREGGAPARPASLAESSTQVKLPGTPPGAVESLRAKTKAGDDRFVVEEADEILEPRLDVLRQAFLEPASVAGQAAATDVLSSRVTLSASSPTTAVSILDRPGINVRAATSPAPSPPREGINAFLGGVSTMIEPWTSLESAAFKVLQIQGKPDTSKLASTVHFELCAAGEVDRRQWTGTATLDWSLEGEAWKLMSWRTLEWVQATLRSRPFEDVTEAALGSNDNFTTLIAPGVDDFRDRIDGATGIDVYGHHGLAVGDANGDGLDDLYVSMPAGLPNQLLLGREGGAFSDGSAASGADALDGTSQALFLDLENDGDEDLFLVTETGILVLNNDGRGRFRETSSGIAGPSEARTTPISAAAADYDSDGFVDAYVCSYVFWRGSAGAAGSRLPFPYHEAHNGAPNFLLRNKGDGAFEDVTEKSGLNVDNTRFSFAASWGDPDSDNDPDLYVANDFGSNNLYRNNGNGTFTEITREAGVEDVGAGMSVAWEDVDNDGDLDLYVGNMLSSAGQRVTGTSDYKAGNPALQTIYRRHARGNSLFRNRGDGTFEDVSEPTRAYFGRWSWASGFVDFNLDGREDIFVQNGFLSNSRKDDL